MNTAYRVWDGEKMHHWDDEGISLNIEDGNWYLYRKGKFITSNKTACACLMWGTGQKDEDGKMIYPGDEIEYYIEDFSIIPKMVRLTKTIVISGGLHNIPSDYAKSIRVIGDAYGNKEGAE
ncbi:YopX family protein [Bacillus velezensis]|uniref:YopX family protein n=1 Tax=Bacillus velezensis TaxID=492670 RepID=UPI0021F22647|nr:YopX family protein [Bacillus velezensis]MCV4328488.1 YopX family protein [Bacillus velezensis]